MFGIVIATVLIGAVGCLIGFFLTFSAKKFEVEVDPKETAILEALPGNNCGGCGFAGCADCAKAIAEGKAAVTQCPVGGAPVAQEIASIMGVDAGNETRMIAYVRCSGDCTKAKDKYIYSGVQDCNAAKFVPGGSHKACSFGCMGFGSCVKACEFDAIHVIDGIAKVDKEKCKACGKCIAACPQHIISMVPYDAAYIVSCRNEEKGKDVMKECSIGCIACHICEKNCPEHAITVNNNIAEIDQDKCVGCGICADKCPKKIILLQPGEVRMAASNEE
jgi:Na+-translocating ferredoxin:NAD+ oxidoreductase RNF subunit RnfB